MNDVYNGLISPASSSCLHWLIAAIDSGDLRALTKLVGSLFHLIVVSLDCFFSNCIFFSNYYFTLITEVLLNKDLKVFYI